MFHKILFVGALLSVTVTALPAANTPQSTVTLSTTQIVEKNVTARGGLPAWRAVKAMSLEGKMGVGGNERTTSTEPLPSKKNAQLPTDPRPKDEVQLPFVMEMQRPRKLRFEIQFKGQTAVQVFDGEKGWKLRPYLNRREVEPYTEQELKLASAKTELDGPLIDYAAKGTQVQLEGADQVDGHDTYKLKLTMKNNHSIHVWIDAKTFLETKIEGAPRTLDGVEHPVEVYYTDYRQVKGLQIPFTLETKVLPAPTKVEPKRKEILPPSEKILVDHVTINTRLDSSVFEKPRS